MQEVECQLIIMQYETCLQLRYGAGTMRTFIMKAHGCQRLNRANTRKSFFLESVQCRQIASHDVEPLHIFGQFRLYSHQAEGFSLRCNKHATVGA